MKPIVKSSIWCASFLAAGIGIGRWTHPAEDTPGTAASAAAPTKASRAGEVWGDRGASGAAELDDLLAMLHSDSSGATQGILTSSVRGLPPARLAALAREIRELQRISGYDGDRTRLEELILQVWTAADPKAALEFARTSPSRSFRSRALRTVFGVLGEKNPEEAIALARGLGEASDRYSALFEITATVAKHDPARAMELFAEVTELTEGNKLIILTELAKKDPVKAVEALSRVSPHELNRSSAYAAKIFRIWAASDPDAVLAWADGATHPGLKKSAIREACAHLATSDPAEAMGRLDKFPKQFRKELLATVMQTWADTDVQGALAAAKALPQPIDREAAMSALADQIYHATPAVGAEMVLAMPRGMARNSAIDRLITSLRLKSGEEKAQVLGKFEGLEHSRMASLIAPTMIAQDTEAAIKLFTSIPPAERDRSSLRDFMGALAELDSERAMAFAQNLPSESDRAMAALGLIQKLTDVSPAEAAERLAEIREPRDRQSAMRHLAQYWGHSDSAAALQWAQGLTGEERNEHLPTLLSAHAKDDPREAGSQLLALMENPGDIPAVAFKNTAWDVAREMAGVSPAEAARWLRELPQGGPAEAAVGGLASAWSTHDPAAAAEWVATLPEGGMRDAGIGSLASSVRHDDPASAFEWGLTITDATRREGLVTEVIREWASRDPDAVEAAIRAAPLDATLRRKYHELLESTVKNRRFPEMQDGG